MWNKYIVSIKKIISEFCWCEENTQEDIYFLSENDSNLIHKNILGYFVADVSDKEKKTIQVYLNPDLSNRKKRSS